MGPGGPKPEHMPCDALFMSLILTLSLSAVVMLTGNRMVRHALYMDLKSYHIWGGDQI